MFIILMVILSSEVSGSHSNRTLTFQSDKTTSPPENLGFKFQIEEFHDNFEAKSPKPTSKTFENIMFYNKELRKNFESQNVVFNSNYLEPGAEKSILNSYNFTPHSSEFVNEQSNNHDEIIKKVTLDLPEHEIIYKDIDDVGNWNETLSQTSQSNGKLQPTITAVLKANTYNRIDTNFSDSINLTNHLQHTTKENTLENEAVDSLMTTLASSVDTMPIWQENNTEPNSLRSTAGNKPKPPQNILGNNNEHLFEITYEPPLTNTKDTEQISIMETANLEFETISAGTESITKEFLLKSANETQKMKSHSDSQLILLLKLEDSKANEVNNNTLANPYTMALAKYADESYKTKKLSKMLNESTLSAAELSSNVEIETLNASNMQSQILTPSNILKLSSFTENSSSQVEELTQTKISKYENYTTETSSEIFTTYENNYVYITPQEALDRHPSIHMNGILYMALITAANLAVTSSTDHTIDHQPASETTKSPYTLMPSMPMNTEQVYKMAVDYANVETVAEETLETQPNESEELTSSSFNLNIFPVKLNLSTIEPSTSGFYIGTSEATTQSQMWNESSAEDHFVPSYFQDDKQSSERTSMTEQLEKEEHIHPVTVTIEQNDFGETNVGLPTLPDIVLNYSKKFEAAVDDGIVHRNFTIKVYLNKSEIKTEIYQQAANTLEDINSNETSIKFQMKLANLPLHEQSRLNSHTYSFENSVQAPTWTEISSVDDNDLSILELSNSKVSSQGISVTENDSTSVAVKCHSNGTSIKEQKTLAALIQTPSTTANELRDSDSVEASAASSEIENDFYELSQENIVQFQENIVTAENSETLKENMQKFLESVNSSSELNRSTSFIKASSRAENEDPGMEINLRDSLVTFQTPKASHFHFSEDYLTKPTSIYKRQFLKNKTNLESELILDNNAEMFYHSTKSIDEVSYMTPNYEFISTTQNVPQNLQIKSDNFIYEIPSHLQSVTPVDDLTELQLLHPIDYLSTPTSTNFKLVEKNEVNYVNSELIVKEANENHRTISLLMELPTTTNGYAEELGVLDVDLTLSASQLFANEKFIAIPTSTIEAPIDEVYFNANASDENSETYTVKIAEVIQASSTSYDLQVQPTDQTKDVNKDDFSLKNSDVAEYSVLPQLLKTSHETFIESSTSDGTLYQINTSADDYVTNSVAHIQDLNNPILTLKIVHNSIHPTLVTSTLQPQLLIPTDNLTAMADNELLSKDVSLERSSIDFGESEQIRPLMRDIKNVTSLNGILPTSDSTPLKTLEIIFGNPNVAKTTEQRDATMAFEAEDPTLIIGSKTADFHKEVSSAEAPSTVAKVNDSSISTSLRTHPSQLGESVVLSSGSADINSKYNFAKAVDAYEYNSTKHVSQNEDVKELPKIAEDSSSSSLFLRSTEVITEPPVLSESASTTKKFDSYNPFVSSLAYIESKPKSLASTLTGVATNSVVYITLITKNEEEKQKEMHNRLFNEDSSLEEFRPMLLKRTADHEVPPTKHLNFSNSTKDTNSLEGNMKNNSNKDTGNMLPIVPYANGNVINFPISKIEDNSIFNEQETKVRPTSHFQQFKNQPQVNSNFLVDWKSASTARSASSSVYLGNENLPKESGFSSGYNVENIEAFQIFLAELKKEELLRAALENYRSNSVQEVNAINFGAIPIPQLPSIPDEKGWVNITEKLQKTETSQAFHHALMLPKFSTMTNDSLWNISDKNETEKRKLKINTATMSNKFLYFKINSEAMTTMKKKSEMSPSRMTDSIMLRLLKFKPETKFISKSSDLEKVALRIGLVAKEFCDGRDVAKFLSLLRENGSFSDINYENDLQAVRIHGRRIGAIAKHELENTGSLSTTTVASYDYLTYHVPSISSTNWWWHVIGIPSSIWQAIFIAHKNLSPVLVDHFMNRYFRDTFAGAVWDPTLNAETMTGGNFAPRAVMALVEGYIRGKFEKFYYQVKDLFYKEVVDKEPYEGNGFRHDGCLHQHNLRFQSRTNEGVSRQILSHIYNNNYGKEFLKNSALLIWIVDGTIFDFGNEIEEAVFSSFFDCEVWLYRYKTVEPTTTGRFIDSGRIVTKIGGLDAVERTLKIFEKIGRKKFAVQSALHRYYNARPEKKFALEGNRYFFSSDLMAHQRRNYMASLRLLSRRSSRPESKPNNLNGENSKGYYQGDGFLTVLVTGKEYGSFNREVFQVYDWARVPGTTCLYTRAVPQVPTAPYFVKHAYNDADFVGGVSNGQLGVASMIYARPTVALKSKKSWFFFDDMVVCLGSDIFLPREFVTSNQVSTILTQVEYAGTYIVGNPYWVRSFGDRENYTISLETYNSSEVTWIYHNLVGYVPLNANVELNIQIARKYINKAPISIFSSWIDHSFSPVDSKYSYAILPSWSPNDVADFALKPTVAILNQTKEQHTVCHSSNVIGGVLFEAGCINLNECFDCFIEEVCLDKPGMILLTLIDYRNGFDNLCPKGIHPAFQEVNAKVFESNLVRRNFALPTKYRKYSALGDADMNSTSSLLSHYNPGFKNANLDANYQGGEFLPNDVIYDYVSSPHHLSKILMQASFADPTQKLKDFKLTVRSKLLENEFFIELPEAPRLGDSTHICLLVP